MVGFVAEAVCYYGLDRNGEIHSELLGTGDDVESLRDEVVFMQGVADSSAHGLDEGVTHSATNNQVVYLGKKVLKNCEFRRYLGSADDSGEGALGILQHVIDGLDLTFHQVAEHLVIGEVFGDEGGGSMCAMCGSECVVDVAVCVGSKFLGEFLLGSLHGLLGSGFLLIGGILCESAGFSFLLCIEAEVLEKQGLTRLEGGSLCISSLAVVCELNGNAKAFAHVGDDVFQGKFRIYLLGTAEVAHNDKGTAAGEHLLESRNGPADAGVVGNFEVFVQGDIEIDTDYCFFAGEIIGINVLLHNILNFCNFPGAKLVNYMKRAVISAFILLALQACAPKQSNPVKDAIQDKVAAQLGELKSLSFTNLELIESSTFGDEIARRRNTIELRRKQNLKLAEGYQDNGKVLNAKAKLDAALKDEAVLKGIDALERRLADHDSLSVKELDIYKFSAVARTSAGSTDIKDMFIAITPENEIVAMDYTKDNLLKSSGSLIPGYKALFD